MLRTLPGRRLRNVANVQTGSFSTYGEGYEWWTNMCRTYHRSREDHTERQRRFTSQIKSHGEKMKVGFVFREIIRLDPIYARTASHTPADNILRGNTSSGSNTRPRRSPLTSAPIAIDDVEYVFKLYVVTGVEDPIEHTRL
jgi:hypothetical protein